MAAPTQTYLLLRKSRQGDGKIVVLRRIDFPLRFHFKGSEILIEVTPNGKLNMSSTRLTGTPGVQ